MAAAANVSSFTFRFGFCLYWVSRFNESPLQLRHAVEAAANNLSVSILIVKSYFNKDIILLIGVL